MLSEAPTRSDLCTTALNWTWKRLSSRNWFLWATRHKLLGTRVGDEKLHDIWSDCVDWHITVKSGRSGAREIESDQCREKFFVIVRVRDLTWSHIFTEYLILAIPPNELLLKSATWITLTRASLVHVQSMNVNLEANWLLQWLSLLRRYNMRFIAILAMRNMVSTWQFWHSSR